MILKVLVLYLLVRCAICDYFEAGMCMVVLMATIAVTVTVTAVTIECAYVRTYVMHMLRDAPSKCFGPLWWSDLTRKLRNHLVIVCLFNWFWQFDGRLLDFDLNFFNKMLWIFVVVVCVSFIKVHHLPFILLMMIFFSLKFLFSKQREAFPSRITVASFYFDVRNNYQ